MAFRTRDASQVISTVPPRARRLAAVAPVVANRTTDAESRRRERVRRVQRVKRAGAPESLSIVLQPIVALYTGQSVAFEALARFRSPPFRGPAWWFAEAEAVGLRIQLELRALATALEGLPGLPIDAVLSINASAATVLSPGFLRTLAGADLSRVVLEITEHAYVREYRSLTRRLDPLRARGLRVAVDDAGAGFSTFSHVLNLAPDVVKLDAGLIRGIHRDPSRRALVRALVAFGAEVGCELVAEGIESEAELEQLRELGVRFGQGNHLGTPEPSLGRVGVGRPPGRPESRPADGPALLTA
jgi:EAL domain-containing protein (putative c-di-GMP-specific phosphodiesterase class I)